MAAIFGGIVEQEVVKTCSGKFHTLLQVSVNKFCNVRVVLDYSYSSNKQGVKIQEKESRGILSAF